MPRSHPLVLRSLIAASLFLTATTTATAQDDPPWETMDYGPFLSAAVTANHPEGNVTHKGLAIPFPLTDGARYGALFDLDLMRWSCGWIGDFVSLDGVVFDGVHGVHPAIDGDAIWGTTAAPGWSHGRQTEDVRRIPYGPLPRAWARWRGIHTHGEDVVLSYDVGPTSVLDHPRVMGNDEDALFVRDLRIGASTGIRWHRVADVTSAEIDGRLVTGERAAFAVKVEGTDARWRHRDGALFLELAASAKTVLARITVAPATERGLTRLRELLERDEPCVDPSRWTQPGPRRWTAELTTTITPYEPDRAGPSLAYAASDRSQRVSVESRAGSVAAVERWEDGGTVATLIEEEAAARDRREDRSVERGAWAHWEFEEGRGSVATDRLTGRELEVEGTAWRRGRVGRALEFEGATVARVSRGQELDFHRGVTVSAWLSTDRDGTILSRTRADGPWVAGGKTFFLRDGKLAFDVGWVGVVTGRTSITDGRWHHVALTYDARGQVRLYVDGVLDGVGELAAGAEVEDAVLKLGLTSPNFPGSPWLHAKLDELWIHRRVLSTDEISRLRDRAVPRRSVGYRIERAPEGTRWVTGEGELALELPPTSSEGAVLLQRVRGVLDRTAALAAFRALAAVERSPVAIDRLGWPDENPWNSWMRFGGFDFFDDGNRAALSTWSGDVWIVRGLTEGRSLTWQRIASGLHQPLGLEIVDDEIYVLGRDQITRLVDLNGDGETDFYECFHAGVRNSAHFHEFALDLQLGTDGRLHYLKGARHAKPALFPDHGTLVAVSRDGSRHELLASGLRGPNGLAIGADGAFYTTDQEGHWMPANRINRMVPGGFYGNGWSYLPGGVPESYDDPICWVHPSVDRSPSAPAFVTSDRWIVPRDTLLCLSYGTGEIFRVSMASGANGVLRAGAISPLPIALPTGIHRARFHPGDGQLYVCGLFGWSGNATEPGGFYRIQATGVPFRGVASIEPRENALAITFDSAISAATGTDPARYPIEGWNYRWSARYGSPDLRRDGREGRDRWKVERVTLENENRTVVLHGEDFGPTMQFHLDYTLETVDGSPLTGYLHGSWHHPR